MAYVLIIVLGTILGLAILALYRLRREHEALKATITIALAAIYVGQRSQAAKLIEITNTADTACCMLEKIKAHLNQSRSINEPYN